MTRAEPEWQLVPGQLDYWVSDTGEVWSRPRRGTRGGLLKMAVHDYGSSPYLHFNMGGRTKFTHRVVCETFHGTRPAGLVVRHLNGDSLDNRVVNLAWGTPSENNYDVVRHGRHNGSNKTHCANGHEYTDQNTHVWKNERYCRTCNRELQRAKRAGRTHTAEPVTE